MIRPIRGRQDDEERLEQGADRDDAADRRDAEAARRDADAAERDADAERGRRAAVAWERGVVDRLGDGSAAADHDDLKQALYRAREARRAYADHRDEARHDREAAAADRRDAAADRREAGADREESAVHSASHHPPPDSGLDAVPDPD